MLDVYNHPNWMINTITRTYAPLLLLSAAAQVATFLAELPSGPILETYKSAGLAGLSTLVSVVALGLIWKLVTELLKIMKQSSANHTQSNANIQALNKNFEDLIAELRNRTIIVKPNHTQDDEQLGADFTKRP